MRTKRHSSRRGVSRDVSGTIDPGSNRRVIAASRAARIQRPPRGGATGGVGPPRGGVTRGVGLPRGGVMGGVGLLRGGVMGGVGPPRGGGTGVCLLRGGGMGGVGPLRGGVLTEGRGTPCSLTSFSQFTRMFQVKVSLCMFLSTRRRHCQAISLRQFFCCKEGTYLCPNGCTTPNMQGDSLT